MKTSVSVLNKRIDKLERDMRRVKDIVGLLPPLVKPLEWDQLRDLDKKILRYMIEHENQISFRTGAIAVALGLPRESGRVKVWKSLKRIRRTGRAKHTCILEQDKLAKTWSLRHDEFTFRI